VMLIQSTHQTPAKCVDYKLYAESMN